MSPKCFDQDFDQHNCSVFILETPNWNVRASKRIQVVLTEAAVSNVLGLLLLGPQLNLQVIISIYCLQKI